jgi:hypothetical protein
MGEQVGARDVEKQAGVPGEEDLNVGGEEELVKAQMEDSEKGDEDRWVVKWDGPDDPHDPLNTPGWKKWCVFTSTRPLLSLTRCTGS